QLSVTHGYAVVVVCTSNVTCCPTYATPSAESRVTRSMVLSLAVRAGLPPLASVLSVASDDEAIADGATPLSEFACAGSSAQFALPAASATIDARIANLLITAAPSRPFDGHALWPSKRA